MRITKILFKYITICILLINISATTGMKDAGEYLKAAVVQKTMPNGINVIMLNRGYTPTLALLISFKVGSVDESYKTIGVAHMLEHMLFKGTDVIGTKDFSKEKVIQEKIEEIGEKINEISLINPESKEIKDLQYQLSKLQEEQSGYVISSPYSKIYAENGGVGFNAGTSRDMTTYYIELPSSKLEVWAKLESERLRNPVLREFYMEKGAVLEERLAGYDSNGTGCLFEQFMANSFAAHPYRHPVIGWRSNIEHFSIRDVMEFYRKNYTPSRMTITVVGKQDVDETYKMLMKYFGSLTNSAAPAQIAVREPVQKGERRFEIYFNSNPYLIIGWHKPTFPSRDDYVFDIVEDILSEGRTSRLYRSLIIEKGLAASIDSWNGYPGARYDNLFLIAAMPKYPVTCEKLEQAIYEEIEGMIKNLREDEIKKMIIRKESSLIFQMDNNMGIARILSYYQTNFCDWKYSVNYLNNLRTITMDEVKETVKKYITPENRTVGILRDSRRLNKSISSNR